MENNIQEPSAYHMFKLIEQYFEVLNEIESNEGEMTPELEASLFGSEKEIKERLPQFAEFIDHLENNTTYYKNRISLYNSKIESNDKKVKKLKELILGIVLKFGTTGKTGNKVIETPEYRFYTSKSQSLDINETWEHDSYIKKEYKFKIIKADITTDISNLITELDCNVDINITDTLDKTKLKDDLKTGTYTSTKTESDFETVEDYQEYLAKEPKLISTEGLRIK